MDNYEELKNFILKDIMNAPILNDFLAYSEGKFILSEKLLTDSEAKQLVSEAITIKSMWLFNILTKLLKQVGQQNIAKADTWEKAQFGKASLYMAYKAEEIIDNIIKMGSVPLPQKK